MLQSVKRRNSKLVVSFASLPSFSPAHLVVMCYDPFVFVQAHEVLDLGPQHPIIATHLQGLDERHHDCCGVVQKPTTLLEDGTNKEA